MFLCVNLDEVLCGLDIFNLFDLFFAGVFSKPQSFVSTFCKTEPLLCGNLIVTSVCYMF